MLTKSEVILRCCCRYHDGEDDDGEHDGGGRHLHHRLLPNNSKSEGTASDRPTERPRPTDRSCERCGGRRITVPGRMTIAAFYSGRLPRPLSFSPLLFPSPHLLTKTIHSQDFPLLSLSLSLLVRRSIWLLFKGDFPK